MHEREICVGDIRASNIVFGEKKSGLIDFDFGGECGKRVYPEGYWPIVDGQRHNSAEEGKALQKHHDLFSFAAVMGLHDCDNEKWEEAILYLSGGEYDIDKCLKLLEEISDIDIFGKSDQRERTATGSPPRKDVTKKKI